MLKIYCSVLLILLTAPFLYSTNYYVSNSGNNNNPGTSPAEPWQTLDKVSAETDNMLPGDSIFFERGSVFFGELNILEGGTAGNPLYVGAYGTGANPVLKGSVPVINWIEIAPNIWQAQCPTCPTLPTTLFHDNEMLPVGRYPNEDAPNGGYMVMDNPNGKTTIIDNDLPATPNWAGAFAVVRTRRWIIDRVPVSSHVGNTLTLGDGGTTSSMLDKYGYFFINHISTLDKNWEWAYQAGTKTFLLYLDGINPNTQNIETGVINTGLYSGYRDYITIENLEITRYFGTGVYLTHTEGIVFKNNFVHQNGRDGAYFEDCHYFQLTQNIFEEHQNDGLRVTGDHMEISYNQIRKTGMVPGMGGNGNGEYLALHMNGDFVDISDNLVEDCGYNGIYFLGTEVKVDHNIVRNTCLVKDDGAGIYTWSNGLTVPTGREITNNMVINTHGAPYGTDDTTKLVGEGIYADDRSTNLLIQGNTVAYAGDKGIYIHNSDNIDILDNTVFGVPRQIYLRHDDGKPDYPIFNCNVKRNIFVSLNPSEICVDLFTYKNDVANFGVIDSNYLISPQDNHWINMRRWNPTYPSGSIETEEYSFEEWQIVSGYDAHSQKTPVYYPEYKILNITGPDQVPNGNFDPGLDSWTCFGNGGGNNCDMTLSTIPEMDGNSMRLSFDPFVGNSTALIKTLIGPVSANKNYRVSYSAKGVQNFSAAILYLKDKSTNQQIAPSGIKPYEINRIEQEFIFRTEEASANARLELKIEEPDQAMWLDNIRFEEVNLVDIHLPDLIRFEYNDTHSPVPVTLAKNRLDHAGNAYCAGTTIMLAPFSSIVLIEEPASSTGPVHDQATVTNIVVPSVTGCDWKHFETSGGDVLVSLNPQQENLGDVEVDMYLYSGPARTYQSTPLLDRNWVISPDNAPGDPVRVRLYLTQDELNAIVLADPKVSSINDLGVYKYSANDPADENNDLSDNTDGSMSFISPSSITAGVHQGDYYLEFEVSSFSEFWIGSDGSSSGFPVEFLGFTVEPLRNNALLQWSTASELSNSHFDIQRSADGMLWENLDQVKGAGNSDDIRQYEYLDTNPFPDKSYYRLKQVDFDGGFSYSEVRTFTFQGVFDFVDVYPNPVKSLLNIRLEMEEDRPVTIEITDPLGKTVYHKNIAKGSGRALHLGIPFPRFSPGLYSVIIRSNDTQLVRRIIHSGQ